MLPKTLEQSDVPGYLVRITGEKKSCTGTLTAPDKVLTSGNCVQANMMEGYPNLNIYHFKSDTGYNFNAMAPLYGQPEDLDLYPNITRLLVNSLGKQDAFLFVLEKNVEGYEPLQIPPANYKITGISEECEYNEKASAVQVRRYKAMDNQVCVDKLRIFDRNVQLDESQTCMARAYSAEADAGCSRDLGGPLVCEGKYFRGLKHSRRLGQ